MILGKKNKFWQDKGCLETARSLQERPKVWKKVQKCIREDKEAIKAFLEPVLADRHRTVVFAGLDGVMAETVFSWLNADMSYDCRWLKPGEVLEEAENDLLICIEYGNNTMELAQVIDVQPETCHILIVTGQEESALVKAAFDVKNILPVVVPADTMDGLLLAAFMPLHLDILDDLQLDDVIHCAEKLADRDCVQLEKFVKENSFATVRAVGFSVRQKRHALKEMAGIMCAGFVSPYTGLAYEGVPLNLLYLPDQEGIRKEQLELLKVLRREGQLVYGVESRHEDAFAADGILDLKLLMARNNVYAAFAFLMVFELLVLFKAASRNIAMDEDAKGVKLRLESWMEKKKKLGDSIIIDA